MGFQIDGTITFSDNKAGYAAGSSCIHLNGPNSVAIYGNGTVDGQGGIWWLNPDSFRPNLFQITNGNEIYIERTTYLNSPNHNLEFFAGNVEMAFVRVLAPECPENAKNVSCGHNTDAVDVHGPYWWIHDCYFNVGDDNVAMHANHTLVETTYAGTGHGISIGSLNSFNALSNITVRDCIFNNTVQATRIKTDQGSSGYLRDVLYTNLTMYNVGQSILLTMYYIKANVTTTLKIHNITFSNIVSQNATEAGEFTCVPESPCKDITLYNITHINTPPKMQGWTCENIQGSTNLVTPAICY